MSEVEIIDFLRKFDTPTICNAREIALGGRQNRGFTKHQLVAAFDDLPSMCGYAVTSKIAGKDVVDFDDRVKQKRVEYYKYVGGAAKTKPCITVLQDVDWPETMASFWGEVNTAIHRGFGLEGTLTDGPIRDLDLMARGYQVLGGSIKPSHAFARIEDIDCPVEVFGMPVKPGDIVHADKHGAVVIENDIIGKMPKCIEELIAKEKTLIDAANASDFSVERFLEIYKG